MTVLQLVRGQNDAGVGAVPNPSHRPPEDFLEQGALLAGSDDLVRIAAHLLDHNFKVVEFRFVDRHFQPIDDELNGRLSELLLDRIQAGARDALLSAELHELSVDFVRLRDPLTKGNLQIAQEGVVRTRSDSDAVSLRQGLADLDSRF